MAGILLAGVILVSATVTLVAGTTWVALEEDAEALLMLPLVLTALLSIPLAVAAVFADTLPSTVRTLRENLPGNAAGSHHPPGSSRSS